MKKITSLLLLLIPIITLAEDGPSDIRNYIVLSDLIDKTIPEGQFIIQGTVVRSDVQTGDGTIPVSDVLVGFNGNETTVTSDSLGRFSLTGNVDKDKEIYFYKIAWAEFMISDLLIEEGHRITIRVNFPSEGEDFIKRKPVIYLYSPKELNAHITLDPKGDFSFTYPTYNNGWSVTVGPTGILKDNNTNKSYPYLFWEAKSNPVFYNVTNQQVEGFVISTDTCVQFLESQLSVLGLNAVEQTDFITYWGPVLQQKPFALIQFLVDDECQHLIAEMKISPEPDAMRRIFMLCSLLDDSATGMEIIHPTYKNFERNGFTVVEWGGGEIDLHHLKP
ncbi:MAG: hypothetical protein IPH66_08040 [Crocinitomicaceae bacterium]|nr:hypothetical protein [Crocinitomicaceae bacterium]